MAVTIVDRRIIVSEADTTTGWTNVGFGITTTDIAESTAAVANGLNISDGPMYFTLGAAVDLSDTLVYVYSFNNALQNNWNNTIPPNGLLLGDGTNRIAFHQSGTNRRVFNHSDGPTNWQCLLLDGSQASIQNTAGLTYADAGSFASLNLNAITQVGAYHQTLSKALGGGYNVACDIMRYGNDGIYVLGGGVGSEGNFRELAAADRSTAAQAAHGLFRELNPSSFGAQGPLTFGRTDAATNSYFMDSSIALTYEDRNISDGKYYFNISGNAGATNFFDLRNSTIGTAGPSLSLTCSSNINTLIFNGVSFVNFREPIIFPTDTVTNSLTHSISNCSFANQEEIYPNSTNFSNNTISNYSSASDLGAIVINSSSVVSNWENLTFNSSGTGHAIYIDTPGTYSFSNFRYNNYGANNTTDAVIYNNSGGLVTINVTGGDSPTFRNGTGASTVINNTVSITLTGLQENTEVRVYIDDAGQNGTEIAGVENSGTTFAFSVDGGETINIIINSLNFLPADIWGFVVPANNTSIPISQFPDRQYFNPS